MTRGAGPKYPNMGKNVKGMENFIGGIGKAIGSAVKPMKNFSARPSKKKMPSYKKGGMVKKTGVAKLHKGERVLTVKQNKKFNPKKFEATRRKVFGMGKKTY